MNDRRDQRHDEAFVNDVLARTSGSACARAETQLMALVDGGLEGLDRQLVQAHLEHCAGCRAVAVVLGWVGPTLPSLAEVDPGPAFTAGVLAATSGRRRADAAAAHPAGLAGLMDRLGRWWADRILRPGFVTQVAYAATVVLVLLTATPMSPWREAPRRALAVVTAGPEGLPVVGGALETSSTWAETQVDAARGAFRSRWRGVTADLQARYRHTSDERGRLKAHWKEMISAAGDGRPSGVGYQLLRVLQTSRQAWQDWWQGDENGLENGHENDNGR